MSCTVPSIRLNGIIDLITAWYIYIRKATIRLKSFSCCKALGFNYFMSLLLVWEDSLVIKNDISLGFELILGTSYLGIFGPLLVIV